MLISKQYQFRGGRVEITDLDHDTWWVLDAVWVVAPDNLDLESESLTPEMLEAFNLKARADILSDVGAYYEAMREYREGEHD